MITRARQGGFKHQRRAWLGLFEGWECWYRRAVMAGQPAGSASRRAFLGNWDTTGWRTTLLDAKRGNRSDECEPAVSILDLGDGTGLATRGKRWWQGRASAWLKHWLDRRHREMVFFDRL